MLDVLNLANPLLHRDTETAQNPSYQRTLAYDQLLHPGPDRHHE